MDASLLGRARKPHTGNANLRIYEKYPEKQLDRRLIRLLLYYLCQGYFPSNYLQEKLPAFTHNKETARAHC